MRDWGFLGLSSLLMHVALHGIDWRNRRLSIHPHCTHCVPPQQVSLHDDHTHRYIRVVFPVSITQQCLSTLRVRHAVSAQQVMDGLSVNG